MNYKIKIQYDGTRYFGWQKQKNIDLTIQEKIENVLYKKFNEYIQVIGAGRTDAGVHALDYTANFSTSNEVNLNELFEYFNRYLPEDIRIKEIKKVGDRFHSRYNAKSKTYIYNIDNSLYGNVFDRKYSWHIPEILNIEKMKLAAELLEGTHDFKSFTNKSKNKNTVRTINFINIDKYNEKISIEVNGDSFLLNMVRIIVGTLVEVGLEKRTIESIKELFIDVDRNKAGKRAVAKGLFLKEIIY